MLKGNKGEWSESYTLLKLLADGKIYAADSDLNKLNIYYPLIKIIREEKNHGLRDYIYNTNIQVVEGSTGNIIKTIPTRDFFREAEYLLEEINNNQGAFSITNTEHFLNSIDVYSLKAKSTDKSDIRIVVHDRITGLNPELGFSIKSRLGNPSTLLNSNKDTTNFIYKIHGPITINYIRDRNSISQRNKIKRRIREIYNKGCSIEYFKIANEMFKKNLQLVDSSLPFIVAEILKENYLENISSLDDLVNQIGIKDPCNFGSSHHHKFYDYKIKNFLTDSALGMTPAKVWNGNYDATGGYIIVREDGEI